MAPLCADPRQVIIALNPARRQALLKLVDEITLYMISQLQTSADELGSVSLEGNIEEGDSKPTAQEGPSQDGKPQRQQTEKKPTGRAARQAERLQKAAVKHMMEWKKEFLPKLQEIVGVEDNAKIQAERQTRRETMEKKRLDTPEDGEHLISFGDVQIDKSEDTSSLQALYHPIPTRLTTIPPEDRREALSCVLLLLLSTGKYSAHSRALVLYLASALELPQSFVNREEAEIAKSLMESSIADQSQKETMSAEAEAAKRRQENKISRFWKVGLASVAGAAVIGVTGGLAAPLVAGAIGGIMGSVGLGGVASFLGIFWMNGALVGALFGAYGAKMTASLINMPPAHIYSYAKEVEDFRFIPLDGEWGSDYQNKPPEGQQQPGQRRLRVTIGINGWLGSEDDVKKPWRVLGADTEVFALRYEMKTLLALGSALQDLVQSFAWQAFKFEVIKRTVLATLWAALWPIQVLAAASNVDNPFNRASNRSRKAGQLLADALINRVQGERPVTLVGYSLGAAAIHACLQSLAERHAFGLVADVVLIGTPAPSAPAHWRTLRTVVAGRVFNVYSENDMILGFVYRMHSLALGVAGLQAVRGVAGLENVDLSERVSGHLRYPELTGEILKLCGFVGVRAGTEIEKDDVIRMKDDHAEGRLVDFDGPAGEVEEQRKDSKVADDLRGLTISPAALSASEQPRNPPLPRRPTEDKQTEHQEAEKPPQPKQPTDNEPVLALPRRPTSSDKDVKRDPPLARRPVGASSRRATRQLTPESSDADDSEGEYMTIAMEDNDDYDG
ncbi:putative membrane protein C6F6.13c [Tolypocladium ophioglossoides CBS 100239]|uniref:Putative membrane protein C6F6.13c n=1 Tax=Tolypocladium ophioglossoides (strain CBS 100239) TaxID=1163406 RepID=A0A0L0NAY7_TOLOC|nr:putative membrane protein C6F6.13c [Tolypocladium ophioglossoides CBS 100239]